MIISYAWKIVLFPSTHWEIFLESNNGFNYMDNISMAYDVVFTYNNTICFHIILNIFLQSENPEKLTYFQLCMENSFVTRVELGNIISEQ